MKKWIFPSSFGVSNRDVCFSSAQTHEKVGNLIVLRVVRTGNAVEYSLSRSGNDFNVFTLPQEAVKR